MKLNGVNFPGIGMGKHGQDGKGPGIGNPRAAKAKIRGSCQDAAPIGFLGSVWNLHLLKARHFGRRGYKTVPYAPCRIHYGVPIGPPLSEGT